MNTIEKAKQFLIVHCEHFGAPIENVVKIGKLTLLPLKGDCESFFGEVQKVTRPYIELSEANYKLLVDGDADYYLLKSGHVVTFGTADGGYALMPLQHKYADDVLRKNNICIR